MKGHFGNIRGLGCLRIPSASPHFDFKLMAAIQFSLTPGSHSRVSPLGASQSGSPLISLSVSNFATRSGSSFSNSAKRWWPKVTIKASSTSGSSSSSSLESMDITATPGQVTEVNKDTFWPIVNSADGKTVVLDMYTQWCGPCKVIAPKFEALSEKYLDVVFLKLDCNIENKPLAKELGIKVVPTFKILKDGKVVKEVTGAKFDDLLLAIETVRSS